MRTRQFVCSDPEVLKRIDRFIPAAGEPATYGTAKHDTLEYKLVYGAMMQTSFAPSMGSWHVQGLYIITPSGKLLAGGNTVSEPAAVVREMDKGLERYLKMPREERLLPKAPDPARDRVPAPTNDVRPPVDGLILRMVSRGLPAEGMKTSDIRHPMFVKLDRVWYTQKEARSFVPPEIKVGAKAPVKQAAVLRLALLYLGVYFQPMLYWQTEEIKEATLTAEIVGVKEDAVEIRYTGRARMEGTGSKRVYESDLLGKATWRPRTQTFSAFELLAIGTHSMGPAEKTEDGPRTAPVGMLFTLNGKNVNDQLAPTLYRLYFSAE